MWYRWVLHQRKRRTTQKTVRYPGFWVRPLLVNDPPRSHLSRPPAPLEIKSKENNLIRKIKIGGQIINMELRSAAALIYRKYYKTKLWARRRFEQLRDKPYCEYCASRGRTTVASVADHVIPHKGDWHLFCEGTLQSLCEPCHSRVKQSEEVKGFSSAVGPDGVPLDAKHPSRK